MPWATAFSCEKRHPVQESSNRSSGLRGVHGSEGVLWRSTSCRLWCFHRCCLVDYALHGHPICSQNALLERERRFAWWQLIHPWWSGRSGNSPETPPSAAPLTPTLRWAVWNSCKRECRGSRSSQNAADRWFPVERSRTAMRGYRVTHSEPSAALSRQADQPWREAGSFPNKSPSPGRRSRPRLVESGTCRARHSARNCRPAVRGNRA